jgi:putative spermidine/putrescine transport system permease protein
MVTLSPQELIKAQPLADRRSGRPRQRPRVSRHLILGLAAIYFLVPLYAAGKFALQSDAGHFSFTPVTGLPHQAGFASAFELSAKLAVVTTVISLVLMVPTAVLVHLKFPALRRLLDGITILPIVIPPVVLIVGVLQVAPSKLKGTPYLLALEYVVLAMPFAYRSIDAGLRALDLKTLVEASRSLGGNSATTLGRVLLPNLRSAIMSATVLTVALVLGEYTMATLDQYQTFSVWITNFDQTDGHTSVAASLMALLVTWAILVAISFIGGGRRRNERTSG